MDWVREYYDKEYAPNTRQTMHQFCDAGLALYNPDRPDRPVNSPKVVYQIESAVLVLLRTFGTPAWYDNLAVYLAKRETLVAKYAKERKPTGCVSLGRTRHPKLSFQTQHLFHLLKGLGHSCCGCATC
jgi:hypothetical protein